MARCDPGHGKFMACSLLYRGDVVSREAVASAQAIRDKGTVEFVDWSPTGLKVSMVDQPSMALQE